MWVFTDSHLNADSLSI